MASESGGPGAGSRTGEQGGGRRDFLKKAAMLPAALMAARDGAAAPAAEQKLPQIRLGKHSVSRLICGTNPFNAGAHRPHRQHLVAGGVSRLAVGQVGLRRLEGRHRGLHGVAGQGDGAPRHRR